MLFKKEIRSDRQIPNRIKGMSTHELKGWMNTSIMELGMIYDQWNYHNAPSDELDKIMNIVQDIWAELKIRNVD